MSAFNDLADAVRSAYEASGGLTVPQMTSIISSGASDSQDVIDFIQRTQTSVTVPSTIEYVGRYAFSGSSDLTQVKCLGNITSLSDYAFYNCANLSDIKVTNKLTSVGNSALYTGNDDLTVTISSALNYNSEIYNNTFYRCKGIKTFFVDSSITWINEGAFAESDAEIIKIPSTIESVAGTALEGCAKLMGSGCVSLYYCGDMHDTAFQSVACGAKVLLEDGIQSIAGHYFNMSDIKSISIPASVTEIEEQAFAVTTGLSEVIIPASVSSLGYSGFYGSHIQKVVFNGPTSVGQNCFGRCLSLKDVSLHAGMSIGAYAFSECTSLTSIVIPAGVIFTGERTFVSCTNLSTVTYGSVSMVTEAFRGCTALRSMDVSAVDSIPQAAFTGCTNLASLSGTAGKGIGYGAIANTLISVYDLGSANPPSGCFSYAWSLRTVSCTYDFWLNKDKREKNPFVGFPWGAPGPLTGIFADDVIPYPYPDRFFDEGYPDFPDE